ncbi:protein tyrosine phosphatase, putative [Plasmodium knowlesi strain H]|uniref:Protein tyrosine phosphatase, putative n=3 Tax=Plasmodium knowlesi TaxID=5850 RepID=A0A5K1V6T7_PLAKH|nr:protein tyrosine phosphatase, putative [Plasmodium knowlesi strain H]OTN68759.1 putative Dual specificity phosphatase [Plasmodium knowlesi]CAA9986202.1 protein tyrosine phosphatase, putative [Plasmodium knowlesi strain H]SBO25406.1 protein tyrosine phosphatase, putative [Plasmodium knowlesi strain H]SBO27695.1 protein tyrosine phosphatase, putative [Plasmodium knowlesi strain H]VVS75676.1 protein tyrosine phosphatase, putative [Plasmodium knowlesi strain H]|eukprot:XP_002257612.1 dual specificity phosphatase, putative [Plasmodium knowlesi strain H]
MVEDEGVTGLRGVCGTKRVNAARPGGNSEDDEERRNISLTKDDTTHSQEDEGGGGAGGGKEEGEGEFPPLGTSKGTIQMSIRGIKVDRLNLNLSSFRRKKEEEKKKEKKEKQDEDGGDDCDDEHGDDPPSGTPMSDKEDVLTASSSTCTELLDGRLLLSGYEFASNDEEMRKKYITHIVNMGGEECPNKFEGSHSYRTYYVKDDLRQDIFYTLLDAAHYIEEILSSNEGNKILVHCKKGVSRSVIVIIFFLMTHLELSFADAFDLVKRQRPLSNPNLSFVSQLLRLFVLRKRLRSFGKEPTDLVGSTEVATLEESPQYIHPTEEVTFIFRISATGKELTLTNMNSFSTDLDTCTDTETTKPIQIDERFNYVLTRHFRAFYLLVLDPTFEDVCTPLFERFAKICKSFFHGDLADSTDLTQTIVRSHVGNFMQRLQLDTQLFSRLPCNDEAYLKLREVLQLQGGGGATTR